MGGERGSSARPTPSQIAHDLPRAAAPLEVGAHAPVFRVQSATEAFESTNALRTGSLVLVFYIGDSCIYCRRQLEEIEQHLGEFRAANATVWAISADSVEASAELARTLHVSFPLPSDPELNVVRAFGVESSGSDVALPSVFVLAPDGAGGRVSYRHVGATQDDHAAIEEIIRAVRDASHPSAAPASSPPPASSAPHS